ncbi:CoaE-domain-containing protein, partial [Gyrodon lividus]
LVVGLTGGIATGKSTVSALLASHGIPIIDADSLARQVVEPGTHAHRAIVKFFGEEILLSSSESSSPPSPDTDTGPHDWRIRPIDRKKLGSIVFNDEGKRKVLNGIVHPAVTRAILWGVVKAWVKGEKIVVVDVPLLIEGGLWKWMGEVVVAYCSPDLQLQRLMFRDNSTRADASSRLNSQLPITSKVAYADIVIDNSGTLTDLEGEVMSCIGKLERAVGWGWLMNWLVPPVGVLSAVWCLAWRALRRRREEARRRTKRSS